MNDLVLNSKIVVDPITKMEILPCPFCGGKADIDEVSAASSNPRGVAFAVTCIADNEDPCPGYAGFASWSRRSDAIKAWNKRAS